MEDAGDEANALEAIERAMAGEAPADLEDPSDHPEAA